MKNACMMLLGFCLVSGTPGHAGSERLVDFQTRGFLVRDSKNHFWALRVKEADLAEWDGQQWVSHGKPKEAEGIHEVEFASDGHDHGWMIPADSGKTPVYDFAKKQWRVFDSLEKAVEGILAPGDRVYMQRHYALGPLANVSHDAAFVGRDNVVHVLSKGAWTRTAGKDVGDFDASVSEEPFFDDRGTFCVSPGTDVHYEFHPPDAWVKTSVSRRNRVPHSYHPPVPYKVPAGCKIANVWSCATDFMATWLVTENGQVWKYAGGLAVQLHDSKGPLTLKPHSVIEQVQVDRQRNAFIRYAGKGDVFSYTMVKAAGPVPSGYATKVENDESGDAVIRLSRDPRYTYRWSLGGGSLGTPVRGEDIRPVKLGKGDFQVLVNCYDEELNHLGGTAIYQFKIKDGKAVWSIPPGLPGREQPDKPLAKDSRCATFNTWGNILPDSRHHLWALRQRDQDLAEWDGQRWLSHGSSEIQKDVVEGVKRYRVELELLADNHDHGWAIPGDNGPTRILDFSTATWRQFDTLEKAVEEVLRPGDRTSISRNLRGPLSHTTGIKAFLARYTDDPGDDFGTPVMHVLRNGRWTRTLLKTFAGNDASAQAPPFFDELGRLRLFTSSGLFRYDDQDKWVSDETGKDKAGNAFSGLYVPEDCPIKRTVQVMMDRAGVYWLKTPAGEYWKWVDGAEAKVLDKDGSSPLTLPETPGEVILDAAGNAIVRFSRSGYVGEAHWRLIAAKAAPPVTSAKIDQGSPGTVIVHLAAGKNLWQRWRLDQEPWHRAVHQGDVTLDHLSTGPHELTVQVFDDELTPVGKVQVLPFTVAPLVANEFATLLSRLREDVSGREQVAGLLKAQGIAVLPRLTEALKQSDADSSLQWWLKAIIQHIEMQSPAVKKD